MESYMVNTELVSGPDPLATAAELRTHLFAVYERTEDAFLETLIKAATAHAEQVTWRKFVDQTWRLYLDRWPMSSEPIYLPYGRVSEVSLFRWLDDAAVDHDLISGTDYNAALFGSFPRLQPVDGWPSGTLFDVESIRVEFTCGYGAAADVPADLKHAVLMLAAHWYENRETVIVGTTVRNVPRAFDALISPYKLRHV